MKFGFFSDPDTTRHCYLRLRRLKEALRDDQIVRALAAQLGVSGDGRAQLLAAAERKIDELRASEASIWCGAPAADVLAASLFEARGRAGGAIDALFSRRGSVQEIVPAVSSWMQLGGYAPRIGEARAAGGIDISGSQAGGYLSRARAIEIAAANDVAAVDEAFDHLRACRDTTDLLYFACTPALAAEYLIAGAAASRGPRRDGDALARKLQSTGSGLLIVEGDAVAQARPPVERTPGRGRAPRFASR